MIQLDVQKAQAELPRLIEQLAHGETVVIVKDDSPVAELRPITQPRPARRPLGLGQGQGAILPGFFESLPADDLSAFCGDAE